ncbi:hypothetical protein LINPERPRIM_LOCUS3808 [Linum perenne]
MRYMKQLFLDAMAICHYFGNPDLFITFTNNAQWPEITNAFKDKVRSHEEDKPAIVARVFRMKLQHLKDDINDHHIFGRTVAASGDIFYLRMLLGKISFALNFKDLRTLNGIVYDNYQDTCQAMGLLSSDNEWDLVMSEVSRWAHPAIIRSMFVSLLIFCQVADPSKLLANWWESMSEDFAHRKQQLDNIEFTQPQPIQLYDQLLNNLDYLLHSYSLSLKHFKLPQPMPIVTSEQNYNNILTHHQYDKQTEASKSQKYYASLNSDQIRAYSSIMDAIETKSYQSLQYIKSRAIVSPTNAIVSEINNILLAQIPGPSKIYFSSDSLSPTKTNIATLELEYPIEFLNSLSFNGIPEHKLELKPFTVVMLLRNINPTSGMCNGTCVLLTDLGEYVISGLIVSGTLEGTTVAIPRIILDVTDNRWPFTLRRRQFPI